MESMTMRTLNVHRTKRMDLNRLSIWSSTKWNVRSRWWWWW